MGLFNLLKSNRTSFFTNIREYSFLVNQLIRIDILTGYKKSYIGILWMVIYPIISVIIWVIMNSAGIIQPGESSIPYPAYVLLSTSIWGFFIGIYQTTSKIILSGGRMMIMNKFPQEVFMVNKIFVHLILFVIPFIVNIAVLLIYGVRLSWMSLLFPITLLPLLLAGLSIGLVVAVLRVVAVDLVAVIDEGLKVLMFLTPIVYTPKLNISVLATFIEWNPLTYLVGFSRDILISGTFYEPQSYLICSIGAFVAFIIGFIFFQTVGPKVLERLIAN
ncbi:MAG: lipopolysaccharide transport system permease protein [Saprospiraceae bacterium]|jgi:lipopolysaccharide transport system permease protein